MSITAGTVRTRSGLRAVMLITTAALSGSGLLLAGCSAGATGSSATASGGEGAASQGSGAAARPAVAAPAPGSLAGAKTARLVTGQAIIRTASLTLRVASVTSTAQQVTGLAVAAGGYVSSEQDSISRTPGRSTVTIELKIPEAAYPGVLAKLSSTFGHPVSASQHAQDVTGQVADVNSRVASAQDAIKQLRDLLKRAGTVSGLLSVQNEINAQEASLEALQAQQRALARETSYATVTMYLLSQRHHAVANHGKHHGFVAGLAAGWHGLRVATSWLLTVAGALLPFLAVLAVLAAGGWLGLRRYRARRRAQPAAADS
ncbi:MAG TPA: DUF4349 domain-containing protein [Streptosporangiaceae bacterium]